MKNKKLGYNLHRKGELEAINKMEQVANQLEIGTNGGLAGAYITGGLYGEADAIAMIANKPSYSDKEGYIVYDTELKDAYMLPKTNI